MAETTGKSGRGNRIPWGAIDNQALAPESLIADSSFRTGHCYCLGEPEPVSPTQMHPHVDFPISEPLPTLALLSGLYLFLSGRLGSVSKILPICVSQLSVTLMKYLS